MGGVLNRIDDTIFKDGYTYKKTEGLRKKSKIDTYTQTDGS